jgi:FkbM family methyltransferase
MSPREILFHLARAWTTHAPVARGKSALMRVVERRLLPGLPPGLEVEVRSADGRRFLLGAHDPNAFNLMMLGEYDPRESALVRRLVRPGDVCFDVGANDGWYTTLFAQLVGSAGRVHAFEPVPPTLETLRATCERNGFLSRVTLNDCGLSDREETTTVYLPPHRGGASLRPGSDGEGKPFACRVTTLDAYCRQSGIATVRLVKCDVEGAELSVLRGATGLLARPDAPMWLLELHRGTAKRFGYHPAEMLVILAGRGYVFHLVSWKPLGSLVPLTDFDGFADTDNVLCSLPSVHGDLQDCGR